MAEAEERMFNHGEALEEQRRAEQAAEAEGRRVQQMELILQIADLERDQDRSTNRLRRMSHQTLSTFNIEGLETVYIATTELNSQLNERINDWADLLDKDEAGESIYPARGMPEF